ncbi:hypothetical protein B0I35DRAFT_59872 [Stachybotrys elegans]|uniref:Uncharacterized protein n=1 Tax=Stachybotrys elegans TaxID=80388 RepID=A0A8K0SR83_9HYPO|nr:hypothetical protein B0I35DRAFT_59872 [Stachybotrys elegans]
MHRMDSRMELSNIATRRPSLPLDGETDISCLSLSVHPPCRSLFPVRRHPFCTVDFASLPTSWLSTEQHRISHKSLLHLLLSLPCCVSGPGDDRQPLRENGKCLVCIHPFIPSSLPFTHPCPRTAQTHSNKTQYSVVQCPSAYLSPAPSLVLSSLSSLPSLRPGSAHLRPMMAAGWHAVLGRFIRPCDVCAACHDAARAPHPTLQPFQMPLRNLLTASST